MKKTAAPKFSTGVKVASGKGPGLKRKGAYKSHTFFGKGDTKAPRKTL